MKTTQLTELEMVEMWNQYKFNFPTGKANQKQLKQLMKKVWNAYIPKDSNNLEAELSKMTKSKYYLISEQLIQEVFVV